MPALKRRSVVTRNACPGWYVDDYIFRIQAGGLSGIVAQIKNKNRKATEAYEYKDC